MYEMALVDLDSDAMAMILKYVGTGAVKVDIDSEYKFDYLRMAVDGLVTSKAVGKVVVKIASLQRYEFD